jgi:hypothetical protein
MESHTPLAWSTSNIHPPDSSLTKQVLGRNFISKVGRGGIVCISMVTNYLARTLYIRVF